MEALSPDGFTYYYNTQTGGRNLFSTWHLPSLLKFGNHKLDLSYCSVSSWEKPADFPCNEASGSGSGSSKEGESQEGPSISQPELSITQPETSTSQPGTSTTQLETSTTQLETSTTQPETLTTQPEPLPGGEESSNGAQTSQVVEVTEQPSQQRTVTKFSFKVSEADSEHVWISTNLNCQAEIFLTFRLTFLFSVFRKGKHPWQRRKRIKLAAMLLKRILKRRKKRRRSKDQRLNLKGRKWWHKPRGGKQPTHTGPGRRSRRRRIPSKCTIYKWRCEVCVALEG